MQRGGRKMANLFWRFAKCATLALFLALPSVSFGQGLNGKANVSYDLAALVVANTANPGALYNVIVQFAVPPTPAELAALQAYGAVHNPNQPDLSAIGAQ